MSEWIEGMNRRDFLKRAAGACAAAALPRAEAAEGSQAAPPVTLGLIADLHQDVMHDANRRLSDFVDDMIRRKVDAVVQLGDFCQPKESNREILATWSRFAGPRYHVLGNHDMDGGVKREQTAAFYGMPALHYGFDLGGLRFLVLDGNDRGGAARGYARYIGAGQAAWMKQELEKADKPLIVFVHQPIDHPSGVENGAEIRGLLEAANANGGPARVLACLSGHLHMDYAARIEGIHYVQINSASYYWVGEAGASTASYTPELHQSHPYLRQVAAYRDPLWAVATIDPAGGLLTIEGRRSEWVGAPAFERGVAKDGPNATRIVPAISDRRLAI
jgi:3',5'-cyclic-AMP phosphodiesterase